MFLFSAKFLANDTNWILLSVILQGEESPLTQDIAVFKVRKSCHILDWNHRSPTFIGVNIL